MGFAFLWSWLRFFCWAVEGSLGTWSPEGCDTTIQEGVVVCQCYHLTYFAVLLVSKLAAIFSFRPNCQEGGRPLSELHHCELWTGLHDGMLLHSSTVPHMQKNCLQEVAFLTWYSSICRAGWFVFIWRYDLLYGHKIKGAEFLIRVEAGVGANLYILLWGCTCTSLIIFHVAFIAVAKTEAFATTTECPHYWLSSGFIES